MRVFDHGELGPMLRRLRRYLFLIEVDLIPLNAIVLLVPIIVKVEASMELLQRVPGKALSRGWDLVQWLASVVCMFEPRNIRACWTPNILATWSPRMTLSSSGL